MIENTDITKIEKVGNSIADGIEQGFTYAYKTLTEYVREMENVYGENKDEIDARLEKLRLEQERMQASMPQIIEGDIVRIKSIHCVELRCYEVSRVENDGVVSQPAGFHHTYNEIIAVYRFDGSDFKCIWEREDYKNGTHNNA